MHPPYMAEKIIEKGASNKKLPLFEAPLLLDKYYLIQPRLLVTHHITEKPQCKFEKNNRGLQFY